MKRTTSEKLEDGLWRMFESPTFIVYMVTFVIGMFMLQFAFVRGDIAELKTLLEEPVVCITEDAEDIQEE